jgi:AraC-like DNA-binding protein
MSFIGQVELFGVSFQEGGAFPIFGIPLIELQNTTSLLDILNRSDLLTLHEKLREVKSLPARIHLLEEWLLFRLLLGREHNQLVHASLNLLKMRNGRLPIPELAQEFSIGQRQLERLYQNQVGVSPKQYSKLLKVENARLALGRMDVDSSAELAVKLGFYDQPHFIREFSAVMGLTPHSYIKRKRSK